MLINRSMPPGIIIPVLAYPDVEAAVAWLCGAFGFSERLRIGNHRAQLCFGGASVVVTQQPREGDQAAETGGSRQAAHSVMVRVEDVDQHYEHARDYGARVVGSPETYAFGERQYTVEDPAGHIWTFSQAVADVAPEEWDRQLVGQCSK